MSIIELYDNISRGGEIEFIYNNKNYSITHSKDGIHIMEMYNYNSEVIYQHPYEVGEYFVGKEKLKHIFVKVIITFET